MKSLRRITAAALIAYLFLATSCADSKYERSTTAMGTVLTVTVVSMDREAADSAVEAAFKEIDRLENLLSLWKPESEMSVLNERAAEGWTQADQEILDLLETSLEFSRLTEGAFDVTAGPLVRLWGFHTREKNHLPTPEEIKEKKRIVGYRLVEIDSGNDAVRFANEGMEVDFSGVAKGYAVDRAVKIMRDLGVKNAMVNLGGNIYAFGSPAGRDMWNIAVRDPRSIENEIGVLKIKEKGVASSGQYIRFVEFENRRFGHIIDPRTGYPVEGEVLGTTIVAPDALTADIMSTSVFVLGPDEGAEFIKSQEFEGLIILDNGKGGLLVKVSGGLRDSFELFEADEIAIEYF